MREKKKKTSFLIRWIVVVIVIMAVNSIRDNISENKQTGTQTGFLQGLTQNGGSKEQEETHLYLKSKGDGSCAELKGNVLLTVVFVNDSESVWTEADKQAVKTGHVEVARLTEEEAARHGVSLSLKMQYMDSKAQGVFSIEDYTDWAEMALKNAGLKETKGANMILEKKYGVEEAPILLYVNRPGRSFAVRYSGSKGTEYAVFYNNAIDFRHELYHLFGAEDFYYPEKVKETARKYFTESIMMSAAGTAVDDLTAYLIGWTDTLTEAANNFIKETQNITAEEMTEENEKEWFTGEGTKRLGEATYTGQLVEGVAHGTGRIVWDSGITYEGDWANNQMHGQGTMTWPDGSVYVGAFVNGVRQGKGTTTWTDGTTYVGEFANNERNGQGTITWPDGTYYTGSWQNGKQHGDGMVVFASGNIQSGTWNQGEFVQ